MKLRLVILLTLLIFFIVNINGQDLKSPGVISGNIQTIGQYYQEDSIINAALPEHLYGFNGFANINYQKGDFRAGIRYESYLNTLEGYPTSFSGTGIGYRYLSWKSDNVGITIGNFYDQFGSGMIFRAYEERQLGIDNSLDGIRLTFQPVNGLFLKGMVGKQRHVFMDGLVNGNGIIRAFDSELNLNELLDSSNSWKFKATIGGSFVSKFNTDNNTSFFDLPKNVGASSIRLNLRYNKIRFSGEYVHKINDPYPDNQDSRFNYIYKNGEGVLLNLGYSTKGFAVDFSAKHMDNMLWRSTNVNVGPTDLLIGYLPALTKQHTYNLAATLYPYATNFYGEIAYQLDVLYKIPKKSFLGGKYGTSIALNFATAHVPERNFIEDMESTRTSYTSSVFSRSDSILFQDFNVEIKRKINKKLNISLNYFNFIFNDDAVKVANYYKMIYAQIAVMDLTYKINRHHSLRFETQAMWTNEDKGDWLFGQIEYTFSPHWYIAILDQYNSGNEDLKKRVHYGLISAGYINGSHRFSFQYGKQRAGVFCVGGVCRAVPASNGLTFSFTSSF
ncbi:MAG: hypothetical protein CND37_00785 [Bacteroidetes bacterium MED-G20]|nr:MAG: hypothetical protein CND37_00785 [Bacteroidetes bacterium MED-G20]CAI8173956.1 MAG: Uncharacterised protein [Crocinitomicaceae bacterium]|tara:strand:- start:946 stop:2622 length:1677 start_codon:yes stop_codon:yes gene_type:complete